MGCLLFCEEAGSLLRVHSREGSPMWPHRIVVVAGCSLQQRKGSILPRSANFQGRSAVSFKGGGRAQLVIKLRANRVREGADGQAGAIVLLGNMHGYQ